MGEGDYIDILGHRTWFAERGQGDETLVLLHGGLVHSEMMLDSIGKCLGEKYRVAAADRPGHGYTADDGKPFSYTAMGEHTVALLEHLGGAPKTLIGWSDGGVAALFAALARPDLVKSLVLIGANYHHNGVAAAGFARGDPAYQWLLAEYAPRSPDGAEHFHDIAPRMFKLWTTEPRFAIADLARIAMPVLVMAGDRDLVKLDHAVAMFNALPDAQLAIVPGATHGLPMEKPELVARMIEGFLTAQR